MSGSNHEHHGYVLFQYYYRRFKQDAVSLVKWLLLAFLTGYVVGGVSSLFSFVLTEVTAFRENHLWVLLFLPFAGMVIVFTYLLY